MSKNMKQELVPELRFPEFKHNDEWETIELGIIGKVSMCKRILKDETSPKGDIPFYKIGTFGKQADAYISRETYEKYKSKYSYPAIGDILISASGTIGRLVVFDGKDAYFQDSNIVWIDNDEGLVRNKFLFYCYENIEWSTDDNTIARLYNDNLRGMQISKTSFQEQQKIADCLSSLDALITAHTQKHQALQSYKKGLMQNLFPAEGKTVPALRFPEFKDAGEWRKFVLGEVATFSKGKGISKADIEVGGKSPCIRYGELYTLYGETIEEVVSFTNVPVEILVLSKPNDVIIPASGETQEDIATASCVKKEGVALGGDLNIIRSNINGVFLSYYLNSVKKYEIAHMAQGISVIHLYPAQLKVLEIYLPQESSEQQKIADCLSSIDNLITAQAQKIEELKAHKKGLMQQLFPTTEGEA